MEKTKILISGQIDLQTLGRQTVGYVGALLHDERNEVYLDELWFHNETINVLETIWGKECIKKVKRSRELPKDFEYDFMLYPWAFGFTFSPKFAETLKHRAKIKLCYPVYDGSVPPLEWIEIINNNFDICVCPSDYCAHNLKRYGVTIDCFGLEVVVLIKDFFKLKKKKNKKFRFGCLSASENRKNLPFLIESFKKAFPDNNDVELVIKTTERWDIFASLDNLRKTVTDNDKNIILITDFISHSEMEELIESFDVYINPQTTVGFYTSSIEMLPLGIPQILSDIPVHREFEKVINAKNNIIYVPHKKMGREFHAAFDYRQMGVNFEATIDDYVEAMHFIYKNKDSYTRENLVNERKEAAKKFFEKLIKKYNQLTNPDSISVSSISNIYNNTFYMSKRLAEKYKNIHKDIDIKSQECPIVPKVYEEEKDSVFKAIELIAVRDQNMYLGKMEILPKYESKMRITSAKYNVKVPYFIYKLFKIYAKIMRK